LWSAAAAFRESKNLELFMAWNEPGGSNKDPWSGKGGDQGPPELDEVVRKLQQKFGGLFGGKSSSGGTGGSPSAPNAKGVGLVGAILFLVWIASGIYIIEPAERGVVLRFGAYNSVTEPGPHWHLPFPIETVQKVNVDRIETFPHTAQMLTRDENIVDIGLTVQFRVQDAADYLFQDRTPEKTLQDATETIVREVIGKSDLDYILTEGRGAIQTLIKDGIQSLLTDYRTGLMVTSVNMQPAKPPEQVKSAFDDAIKAREDKERIENEAEAYANEVVPKARGAAGRRLADASAYRDRVIAEAEGDTSRFLAVMQEYRKAPEVTRERLYIDAIEQVLTDSSKVMLDVEGGNNLVYLPLDRLLDSRGGSGLPATGLAPSDSISTTEPEPVREVTRGRRAR
jgi:membrane protease subunit HflK